MEDNRKECCKDEENLGQVEIIREPDLVFRRCKVCNCRHFEMSVDPGKLGLKGSEMK